MPKIFNSLSDIEIQSLKELANQAEILITRPQLSETWDEWLDDVIVTAKRVWNYAHREDL